MACSTVRCTFDAPWHCGECNAHHSVAQCKREWRNAAQCRVLHLRKEIPLNAALKTLQNHSPDARPQICPRLGEMCTEKKRFHQKTFSQNSDKFEVTAGSARRLPSTAHRNARQTPCLAATYLDLKACGRNGPGASRQTLGFKDCHKRVPQQLKQMNNSQDVGTAD